MYRRYAGDVNRWATRFSGSSAEAADIVQEVFLVVQRRLPEFRGQAKLSTWLYEITLRLSRDHRRKAQRWLQMEPVVIEDAGSDELVSAGAIAQDPCELLQLRQRAEVLCRIIARLDEKYRLTLELAVIEGLSGPEIAARTGTTPENVWVRLNRVRQKCLDALEAWESRPGACTPAPEPRRPPR